MTPPKYIAEGFVPATQIAGLGLVYLDQANVSIIKGDPIFDNGSGYATNVGTAFAATFRGIAAVSKDNSAGSDGDLKVAVIPAAADVKYWIVNGSATVAAQTDVGEIVDLEAGAVRNTIGTRIDVTDVSLVEWGFVIDEIDISTLALAAAAGGFVLGRFQKVPQ